MGTKIHKFEIKEDTKEIIIDWHYTTSIAEVLTERPFRVGNGYACCIKYELLRLIENLTDIWILEGIANIDEITVIDNTL